ncbi:MAG: DEAD/DEAH box helicase [Polyangiaceae bacterium]
MTQTVADYEDALGPELTKALRDRGYETLTLVQQAVLDPSLAGRDLRVSSQTGSGKTLAIGFAVRELVTGEADAPTGAARPRVLVVVPTRELAKQVEEELTWLFAPMRVRIASVTGGSSYRDERRAFSSGPKIVVGTPGRLLDHLNRGSIDGSNLAALVLDEADRMLDMGFREDIEAIFAFAPEEHTTHLVSATFAREVRALADRLQTDPVAVEGTPLGEANADIQHFVHLVHGRETLDAVINLLLTKSSGRTLIFARTRADVSGLTDALREVGFRVNSLSGEMGQRERNMALAEFKRGTLDALVATDVAARGIDVQEITRVIHVDPPSDADTYTHRSGRTGRAGLRGTSSVLIPPAGLNRVSFLLRRVGVTFRVVPVPSAEEVLAAQATQIFEELVTEAEGQPIIDDSTWQLAKRIVETGKTTQALARLLHKLAAGGPTKPRAITQLTPPDRARPNARGEMFERKRSHRDDYDRPERPTRERRERREHPVSSASTFRPREDAGAPLPASPRAPRADVPPGRDAFKPAERAPRGPVFVDEGGEHPPRERAPREVRAPRERASKDRGSAGGGNWVPFHVSWGEVHGADSRRLLAMVCRRGGIEGRDVGSIEVDKTYSIVQVSEDVAAGFQRAAGEKDPRDPRVIIRPWQTGPGDGTKKPKGKKVYDVKLRADGPPKRKSRRD